jgi:hypothetical protein
VDHNRIAVCQFQPDDLEEVAGIVRSDGEYSRRVGVGLKIDDRERWPMTWLTATELTPCFCADRWISTRDYRITN